MTALFVVVGAVLGGIIDLIPGVFFGGAIGFLLGRNQELRKRLDKLGRVQAWFEEAQSWFESAQSWFDKAQTSPLEAVEQQAAADPGAKGEKAQALSAEAVEPEDLSKPVPEGVHESPVSPWPSSERAHASPVVVPQAEPAPVPSAAPARDRSPPPGWRRRPLPLEARGPPPPRRRPPLPLRPPIS